MTNCSSFTEPNRNTADYSLTPPSFSGSSFLLLDMEREDLGDLITLTIYVNVELGRGSNHVEFFLKVCMSKC